MRAALSQRESARRQQGQGAPGQHPHATPAPVSRAPLQLVCEQYAAQQGGVEAGVEHRHLALRGPRVHAAAAGAPDGQQEPHLEYGKHHCRAGGGGAELVVWCVGGRQGVTPAYGRQVAVARDGGRCFNSTVAYDLAGLHSSVPCKHGPPLLTKLHEGHGPKRVEERLHHDAQREVHQAQVRVQHGLQTQKGGTGARAWRGPRRGQAPGAAHQPPRQNRDGWQGGAAKGGHVVSERGGQAPVLATWRQGRPSPGRTQGKLALAPPPHLVC